MEYGWKKARKKARRLVTRHFKQSWWDIVDFELRGWQWVWWGFPGGSAVKNHLPMQETRFDPWSGKMPWRRKWQSTPVFLPGKSHGHQNLVGYVHGVSKSWTQLSDQTTCWLYSHQTLGLLPSFLFTLISEYFHPFHCFFAQDSPRPLVITSTFQDNQNWRRKERKVKATWSLLRIFPINPTQ